ncbi:hypothetical protein T11_13179 [Trichinella zimbabwensis]|uniref:Uncharacterized protein n=1 Tax=Trichinella zimbabwensis TaxID=268475 RepID=A0A0V1GRP9_9BILA|nr:hypothetical protein T11_13179 [Trichinella zimbabwensis]
MGACNFRVGIARAAHVWHARHQSSTSKYTTVAECSSDVFCDQFRFSSSSFTVSGIEQSSSAS